MRTFRAVQKVITVFVCLIGLSVAGIRAETAPVTDGKTAFLLSEKERKALTFDVGPEKTTMVQFFTSDSNPLCNEALKWCSSLRKNEERLWKTYVPVAMHVRLWDTGGYRDTFAKDDFDALLQSYSRFWGTSKVFAPLVVVNGVEWAGWARGQEIPPAYGLKGGMLHVDGTELPNVYNAFFTPERTVDTAGGFEFHGVLMAFGMQTRPSDGKNRGNALTHDFVPLLYEKAAMKSAGDGWKATVDLRRPRGLQKIVFAVAFWVTKNGNPVPLQATGGFLPAQ